jgi:uncharacterized membrane protein YfcA
VNTLAFSGLLFLASYGAGLLVSFKGLGGSVVLVPGLVLLAREHPLRHGCLAHIGDRDLLGRSH